MEYLIIFKNLVYDMKRKYYIAIILICIINVVYWYFLLIFCSIYKNNQLSWIQSTLISICFNMIIPVVTCFIIASLRFLAFKFKNRFLFKISQCCYQIL